MDVTISSAQLSAAKAQKNHHHDQIPPENTSVQFAV